MSNPYSLIKTGARGTPVHILEARHDGRGSERLVGANDEFNASTKKELSQVIAKLVQEVSAGKVLTKDPITDVQRKELAQANREMLVAAYHDHDGRSWAEIGAGIGATVTEVADREGFMRRIVFKGEATQGSIIRIRIRSRYTIAVIATSPAQMTRRFIREKYLLPDEFYVKASVRVEERELAQGPGDLLEEKMFECQEAIMVQEDKLWKNAVDNQIVGTTIPLQYLAGGLTPSSTALMQNQLQQWGLPAQHMLIGAGVLPNITGGDSFSRYFDPLSKYEIVTTGTLGTLLGMSVTTDAFRRPEQQVLLPNEVYVVTAPEAHGTFTDRGPVSSKETSDSEVSGVPSRGWFFWEIMSMVIFNTYGVVKGIQS